MIAKLVLNSTLKKELIYIFFIYYKLFLSFPASIFFIVSLKFKFNIIFANSLLGHLFHTYYGVKWHTAKKSIFSVTQGFILSLIFIWPGFLKTGLAKISTHSTTWQFKTINLIHRPIKSLYLTPGSKLMVPRSIIQRLQI